MKLAEGPRPISIWAACSLFLFAGLWSLTIGLLDLGSAQFGYSANYPTIDWDRDRTIVALSAEFTIALIPIVWIFLIARPFARWMVTAIGLWKVIPQFYSAFEGLRHGLPLSDIPLMESALIVLSLALLFTPSANSWFQGGRSGVAAVV